MDEEIRNILETEPGDNPGNYKDTQEDNQGDTHREQLAILVASGRAKEMIGIELTQDQVKSANEKYVEKYFRRYEASLS